MPQQFATAISLENDQPMEKYLKVFASINQDHIDRSDYERFYDHCKFFLLSNARNTDEISVALIGALDTVSNPHIVSIAYKLLSLIDTTKVGMVRVRHHLQITETADAVMHYLACTGDPLALRDVVVTYLYDPQWVSHELFNLVSRPAYIPDLEAFFEVDDVQSLGKQLKLAIHNRRFCNISKYIVHLGSKDIYVCFLVYELLLLCTQSNGRCIELTSRVDVESTNNFLFYFLDFMDERERVVECVAKNRIDEIKGLLSKYVEKVDDFRIDRRIRDLRISARKIVAPPEELRCVPENFDYLFGGACYKDACDCIEM